MPQIFKILIVPKLEGHITFELDDNVKGPGPFLLQMGLSLSFFFTPL